MIQENLQPPFEKKKFTQKPIGVIFWLWLFFPVGIYFMWKGKMWSSKTRIIITSVFGFFIILALAGKNNNKGNDNSSDSNLISLNGTTLNYRYTLTPGDYQEEEVERIGRLVYNLSTKYNSAKKLELTLVMDKSNLEDKYGKKGNGLFTFPDKMVFDNLEEIRKYNDEMKYLGYNPNYLSIAYKLESILQNVGAEDFFKRLKTRTY